MNKYFLKIFLFGVAVSGVILCMQFAGDENKSANFLLQAPQKIADKDIVTLPCETGFNWGIKNRSIFLSFNSGNSGGALIYYDFLPKELDDEEKKKFISKEVEFNEEKHSVYIYTFGLFDAGLKESLMGQYLVALAPTSVWKNKQDDYHIVTPIMNKKGTQFFTWNLEQLADFVSKHRVVFYTGAGISKAGNVFSMDDLEKGLGFEREKDVDSFVKNVLHDQDKILNFWNTFCKAAFQNPPTPAHKALARIANLKQCQIITENIDYLHEHSGIKPLHAEFKAMQQLIKSEDLKDIEAVICLGLSRDDRGLLAWYKQCNRQGKIISVNLSKSDYICDGDACVYEDLQLALPKLAEKFEILQNLRNL